MDEIVTAFAQLNRRIAEQDKRIEYLEQRLKALQQPTVTVTAASPATT